MELKTILVIIPFNKESISYGLLSFIPLIASLIEEEGAPNFCIILMVYFIVISFKVSFAEGSIKLKSKILKMVEIKIPTTAEIK